MLYRKLPNHHCCDSSYQSLANSSEPVCCHGTLVPALPEHRCCGGYYIHVQTSKTTAPTHVLSSISPLNSWILALTVLAVADQTCCPDPSRWRVSVGLGDSCCAAVPYSSRGGQLCCSGSLHDGYGAQCCGGHIVDDKLVCCGGSEEGEVHSHVPGEGWRRRDAHGI